jgi:hypothetical protein
MWAQCWSDPQPLRGKSGSSPLAPLFHECRAGSFVGLGPNCSRRKLRPAGRTHKKEAGLSPGLRVTDESLSLLP